MKSKSLKKVSLSDANLLLTITIVVFFLMYIGAMIFEGGGFLKPQTFFNILNANGALIITACGLSLVMITGSIDISVGGVVALVSMCCAVYLDFKGGNLMNNIERGIDAIDDRVCALDTTKVDLTKANELVKEILWDESNGTLTVVKMNGSQAMIDTKLEKLAVNFKYSPQTQQLVITLDDGTVQNVDLSALITQYEFLDSDTIAFEIGSDGKVSAIVKEGSIQEKHLRPDYLADIKVESAKAVASAKSAGESETKAAKSATDAKDSADRAQEIENEINKKLTMTEFDVNEDGELIYMDNAAYNFFVDNDGNLNWEVA